MLIEIESVLNQFDKIDLEGLEKVKLLNRVDSKFIFHISNLPYILNVIKNDYSLLEINELHLFNYDVIYIQNFKNEINEYGVLIIIMDNNFISYIKRLFKFFSFNFILVCDKLPNLQLNKL